MLVYLHFMNPCIWIDKTLDAMRKNNVNYNYTILRIIKIYIYVSLMSKK